MPKNACHGCGICCHLFLINISKTEFKSGNYHAAYHGGRLYLLDQNVDASCIYLIDNHCSIHTTRPKVCRQFFCSSQNKKFADMIKIIKA